MAALAGFAASFLVGVLVTLLGSLVVSSFGLTPDVPFSEIDESFATDAPLVAVTLVGALSSSFAAGYAAAATAPGDEVPNGLAIGCLLIVFSAVGYEHLDLDLYPLWYTIPTFVLTIPLALLGAVARRGPSAAA